MAEYIERESLIEAAKHNSPICLCMADFLDVKMLIENAPAADVAPVVHGRWIRQGHNSICSECGAYAAPHVKFCPDCGAMMDKEEPNGR